MPKEANKAIVELLPKTKLILKRASLTLFSLLLPLEILLLTAPAFAAPPTVGSIIPSTGSTAPDTAKTFTCLYSDKDGWNDLKKAYLLISASPAQLANSAYLYYDQNSNKLYLRNDANTAWLGGFLPGSDNRIKNSQIKLNCRLTNVFGSSKTLTVEWNITFKPAYSGKTYKTYLKAIDDTSASAGWTQKGDITIQNQSETTPPTGSITINNNAVYSASTSVTLNLSAADSGSGMGSGAQMQFSNDNLSWSTPEAYATAKSWSLPTSDGPKTVYVKYKDAAGNWSTVYSDTIILDTTPPVISINPVTTLTNQGVRFSYSVTDNLAPNTQIIVSGDNSPYTNEGSYNVSLRAQDLAGNTTTSSIISFIIDKTQPQISITSPADGATVSASITILASASDTNGISGVQFRLDGLPLGLEDTTPPYEALWNTTQASNASHSLTAQAKDRAGNTATSSIVSVRVNNDTTPPTGSITINNNASYTNSASVTLSLSAQDNIDGSGLSQMQFSNNNANWSAPEPYTTTKTWTLTSSDGQKTVYVKFKDAAGNWSQDYSDTIILDATAPSTPVVTDDGATTSNTTQLHASWSSSDTLSGITEYKYKLSQDSTSGTTIVDWTSTATEVTKTGLSLTPDKTYFFQVQVRNGAGDWSAVGYSDGITVIKPPDTIPPQISIASPANNSTVSGTVNITASATDNIGLSKVDFYLDNSLFFQDSVSPYVYAWNTLTTSNATHTLKVIAYDTSNNQAQAQITVNVNNLPADNIPPTGTININNNASYTNSTSVTLTLSAQDNIGGWGLDKMQFSTDRLSWSTPEAYATAKSWSLPTSDGPKDVYVKYKDAAGNWSWPVYDTITLDLTPPEVSINSPANGATVSGTITIGATLVDMGVGGIGVAGVQFKLDGVTLGAEDTTFPYGTSWDTTAASSGSHTLTAVARDSLGNIGSTSVTITVNNIAAPVVIDDGIWTDSSTQLHAKWSFSDPKGVVEYLYSVGTNPGYTDKLNWSSTTASEITATGLTLYLNSPNYFNVKAKNGDGLWSRVGSSDGIRYNSPPDICKLTPQDKSAFIEGEIISIYACAHDMSDDAREFQVSIDNLIVKPWEASVGGGCACTGKSGVSFTYNWQTKTGDSGSHKIKVEVRDDKVTPVFKQEVTIFIYKKPFGPPS